MIPKVPKLASGLDKIEALRLRLIEYEGSLRNRFDREFYRKELTARTKLYETLSKKRPAGSDAARFFSQLSRLHSVQLAGFGPEPPPKRRNKPDAPTVALVYPELPDELAHRIHFLKDGSLKRERSATLAVHADAVARQKAPNGDVLFSVAVSQENVQLFERLVESIGAEGLGVPYQKGGSFSGYFSTDGKQVAERNYQDPASPWARIRDDNFKARLYHWTARRGQLDPSIVLPTDFPPIPDSLPWDPDPRFNSVLRHTQEDRLKAALDLVEQIPAEERELVFDEVIYLRYLLGEPVRGGDLRFLARKYISSSSIKIRLEEEFDSYIDLLDAELKKARPIPQDFPGLGDHGSILESDPDPLKRNTPPLSDWAATREHYYLQLEAYGHPVRPRGRIFVWNPDIAFSSLSSIQDAFAPEFVVAEDAFRRARGISEIGCGWVSETSLYDLVRSFFPEAVHQWRPYFLGLQSVDIYVPSAKLAIEYQGKQHYEPVSLFGGEEGFVATQARDARKRALLESNGITLIEWRYDRQVSREAVAEFLARHLQSDG